MLKLNGFMFVAQIEEQFSQWFIADGDNVNSANRLACADKLENCSL